MKTQSVKIDDVLWHMEYKETKIDDSVYKDGVIYTATIADADDLNWIITGADIN